MTNVLILSCGTRNKIVQYFRKGLKGRGIVVAADCSNLAPSLYDADRYYIVPRMSDDGYIDVIFDICKKNQITGVLSLIDPELSLLAAHKDEFESIGVRIIGSPYSQCEMSLNKMKMFEWLISHNYNTAKSYVDKDLFTEDVKKGIVEFPVFVKPVCGSASIAINKVNDMDTVELLFSHRDDLMIQELLDGQEFGADVYIDMISGEVTSIFTKKKIKMRAGETDKSVSFKDDKLFTMIEQFVIEAGYKGQIDIDIFEKKGKYYISEVNPRFGGGYPHAYECGVNHIKMIIENLEGKANKKCIGVYEEGVYMMKYNEVCIRDEKFYEHK
ncbi:MAG: ATP-grasp domain-containing protein [Lachnospiraceae bacterium]